VSDPAAAAAFFDLDRTLISGSSVFVFAVEAWRAGVVPTSEIVGATAEALAFRMVGATDERSDEVRMRMLAKVEGASVAELDAVAQTVLPKLVERVRPESRGLLKMHADAGRDTWIVSASPQAIIEPLAEALAMTGGIGTKAVVADGRYTSELDGSFVYGQGKAEAIQKLVAERGYDLGRSYAYSDSASDLPMMDLVGHPVAVNPDGPLEDVAHDRGWPIVVFARKTKRAIALGTATAGAVMTAGIAYALGRRHGRVAALAETVALLSDQSGLAHSVRRQGAPRG
jgi:HAD superfamily hydrolase (TIGR01490 family)